MAYDCGRFPIVNANESLGTIYYGHFANISVSSTYILFFVFLFISIVAANIEFPFSPPVAHCIPIYVDVDL